MLFWDCYFCYVVSSLLVDIKAQWTLIVSCCLLLNDHGWEKWSQNRMCLFRRRWKDSLSRKRYSWAGYVRHAKINYRIDLSISDDKNCNDKLKNYIANQYRWRRQN